MIGVTRRLSEQPSRHPDHEAVRRAPLSRRRYPQTALSNSNVRPVAVTVTCSSRCALITDPSEPISRTSRVSVSVAFWRLPLSPSQNAKWPVYVGRLGSSGTTVTVPVWVMVNQNVPAPIPDVRYVTWAAPFETVVIVAGTSVHGTTSVKVSTWLWKTCVSLTAPAAGPPGVGDVPVAGSRVALRNGRVTG